MPNDRLRGALDVAGLSYARLAERVGVDPKTAERWVSKARTPHPAHRVKVADTLGVEVTYLWPTLADDPRTTSASRAELVEFYPCRSAVPRALWTTFADTATETFDLLAYAALPLFEDGLVDHLVRRAHDGVRVRILVGDPDGHAIALRGHEEQQGGNVAARTSLSLGYVRDIRAPGFEARMHDTTLYTSIYRADNELLANIHVYGSVAGQSPVLHIRRLPGGRVFDQYMTAFDKIWTHATPVTAEHTYGQASR
jgi:transcriptional regulator with XRE-family HTH domain